MCEQAARYCRAGVQRLLRKPPAALRGLDGLLRWVVARMGDKGVAERELLTPGAAAAAVQRKGTSVILDVSGSPLQPPGMHPAARIPPPHPGSGRSPCPHPAIAGGRRGFLGSLHPLHRLGNGLYPGSCNPRLGGRGGRILVPCAGPAAADWAGVGMQPGSRSPLPGSRTHPSSQLGMGFISRVLHPRGCARVQHLPERLGKRLHPGSCSRSPGSGSHRGCMGRGAHRGSCTLLAGTLHPPDQLGIRVIPRVLHPPPSWGWGTAQFLHLPDWLGVGV